MKTVDRKVRGFVRHAPDARRMPGESTYSILQMHYVYILQSERDKKFYIGMTADLKRRYSEHQAGRVESTKHRLPMKLLCYEAYQTKEEAARREEFLKSSDGRKDIKKRIIESMIL